ncbi:MAG: DNA polymerase III subunit epsilon [Nitrosomonadales bacterium]|jgi:DNA polymerase-3 subunit epsilon|nr:DNA polymerase III subunit epsilon [Nitrosomonadales bacterium]MBT6232617.1 DNA polymerase III subunit epsilon [Nitrosomonadales bacterium]MBT6356059.1 DNA polymerase III subunit epsilon [Nitrosomonadales bacterium]|tara:strand:+ start:901 stop:1569 length:669 start_codon:yes stop_codon:yes gene_type:complete
MRQVFLDTETTGLDPNQGHRIIEIAAVEINNRQLSENQFHMYVNPERDIDAAAQEVHGITLEFLKDKSFFKDIAEDFLSFIRGSELIIHNAPFDIGFLNMELGRMGLSNVEDHIEKVTDSLVMARELRPGQRNNLDALCRAYKVDNSKRSQHGALLDAQLLSEVYLNMTRGQEDIAINFSQDEKKLNLGKVNQNQLKVVHANEEDISSHEAYLEKIQTKSSW